MYKNIYIFFYSILLYTNDNKYFIKKTKYINARINKKTEKFYKFTYYY